MPWRWIKEGDYGGSNLVWLEVGIDNLHYNYGKGGDVWSERRLKEDMEIMELVTSIGW